MRLANNLILLFWVVSTSVFAQVPVSDEVYQQIQEKFLDDDQNLSLEKVKQYNSYLKSLQKEVEVNIENYSSDVSSLSSEEAEKLANKNKYVKSMKMLRKKWLPVAAEKSTHVELVEYLSKIIDLENAIRVEITPYLSEKFILRALHTFMYNYSIPVVKTSKKYQEAKNLINPSTGTYFNQGELQKLKEKNIDISKLDPPADNGVIELIDDISKSSPYKRYRLGENAMHEGLGVSFPEENIGFFKELRKTQSRPKIIFETKDAAGNILQEYKLKMGMEIHSEPTAAALGVTLGLFNDLSKHVKKFKIYIGEMSWEEFVLDFSSYFEYEDLERIVHSHGTDEIHGNYIVFKEGMLEARFKKKQLYRVGPFYPGYKKGKRETRALMVFNMWIGNADLKPGENNKTLIRTKGNKKEMFYMQHDVGFAFGYYGREKPTEFPWSIIKSRTKNNIKFNYRTFVPNDGWDHVSFADSKWMVRKIAQLTREQITECVEFGKWPDYSPYNYKQLIIEKLINRRNQLVEAFELTGEVLPSGKTIQLMTVDKTIEEHAKPTAVMLPNQTIDFRTTVKFNFVGPALKSLRDKIVDGVARISRGIDRISIPSGVIGIPGIPGPLVEALVGTDKKVMKNPNPTGLHDRYIVREGFRFGARVGLGFVFRGDASYVKEYTLVYPVSDLDKVDNHGKWIVDVTMPYRIMNNFLPKNHILITESYIEGAARTVLETPMSGIGNETGLSRINLSRTILSKKKNGEVKVFEDTSNFNQLSSNFYIKLGLLNLDQFVTEYKKGKLNRDIYVLKLDHEDAYRAVDLAMMNNNPLALKEVATKVQEVESNFVEQSSDLSIFGFFERSRHTRTDNFQILTFDKQGKIVRYQHQLEGTYVKRRAWRLITNGEERIARVTMSSRVSEANELLDPYINLNFEHVDFNTTAQELDNAYIPFFNGVVNDKKFIRFNASEHSLTGKYGHLNLHLREKIYKEGIDKLLKLTPDKFWESMSKVLGLENVRKVSRKYIRYVGKQYRLKRVRRKAAHVLNLIQIAQNKTELKSKLKTMMKAIAESIPKKKNSQIPIVLATLNNIMGQENFYVNAEIESPSYQENKMPGRITPYNHRGKKRSDVDRDLMQLQMGDALKIYNLF